MPLLTTSTSSRLWMTINSKCFVFSEDGLSSHRTESSRDAQTWCHLWVSCLWVRKCTTRIISWKTPSILGPQEDLGNWTLQRVACKSARRKDRATTSLGATGTHICSRDTCSRSDDAKVDTPKLGETPWPTNNVPFFGWLVMRLMFARISHFRRKKREQLRDVHTIRHFQICELQRRHSQPRPRC